MSDCPPEQTVLDFLDGKLAPERGAALHEHVDRCPSCRALLASLAPSINRATVDHGAGDHPPLDASLKPSQPPADLAHQTAPLTQAPDHAAASAAVANIVASVLPLVPVERYDVKDEFARGGLGRIFRAHDRRLARPVAVKQLIAGGAEAAKRFIREAMITARLQHPAIVPIYEAGRWPSGEPFYAMKLVSGRSLDQVIKAKKTLAERLSLLPTIISLAEAMAYAHSQRIIHRDLKPANVLVGSFGETVLIDWGLAKDLASGREVASDGTTPQSFESTEVGTVLGTPTYMPPEQAEGKPVDERADVYAIGAILYHTLAGAPPYVGSSSAETLARVLSAPPPPLTSRVPDVPRALAAIVDQAMARDPAARHPTAKELADELVRFQAVQLERPRLQQQRVALAIGVALLTALVTVGALAVARFRHERDEARAQLADAKAAHAAPPAAAALPPATTTTAPPIDGDFAGARVVARSQSGTEIATVDESGAMTLWKLPETISRQIGRVDGAVAFTPDGRWLAATGKNGTIRMFATPTSGAK